MMDISVVIPTYNRKESLNRLLTSLQKQRHPLKEVIIVDASEKRMSQEDLHISFPRLQISLIYSTPSVSLQRNIGIAAAKSSYVFLCDDDIELPFDYVLKLADFLLGNPKVGIASGFVLQKNELDIWEYQYPIKSFSKLVWVFIFQLSIWGDISDIKTNSFFNIFLKKIKGFYHRRGNTFTMGGWPLITDFKGDIIRSTFYGIGASIGKREWFLGSPYDESLMPNGIGDNYGVLLNFPDPKSVHLVSKAYVFHHQSQENRQRVELDYFHRVLTLHYFMKKSKRFSFFNRMFLVWSLIGNLLLQVQKLQLAFAKTTVKVFFVIIFKRNPYFSSGNSSIQQSTNSL